MSHTDNQTHRVVNRNRHSEASRRATVRSTIHRGDFDALDSFSATRSFRTGVEF